MLLVWHIWDKRDLSVKLTDDGIVLLQAMKVEPPLDAKCRDKFLVQSVEITPDKEFLDQSASVRRSLSRL